MAVGNWSTWGMVSHRTHYYYSSTETPYFISMSNLTRHKMSNEKELEEIIINKGEMVYKELVEREGRESTARDIPVESYVYAYLKAIDSAYRYLIDTHQDDKRMGPRLDSLENRFKIVMKDLWSYYNKKK
jgi:hypothetical protein